MPRLPTKFYQSRGKLRAECCMKCNHFRFESHTSPQALCRVRGGNPPMPAKYWPLELGDTWDEKIPGDCKKFKSKQLK